MTIRESIPNTGETADTRRLYQAALITPAPGGDGRGGVFPSTTAGLRIHQTPTASANLLVEAGVAAIPMSATSGLNGSATFVNDAALVQRYLQDFPADSQPRVDVIVARAQDAAGGDSDTVNSIAVVKGTAGSSTTPPIPSSWNAIPLYTVALPANATTVTDGMLTRVAQTVVANGGRLPVPDDSQYPPTPSIGQPIYDLDLGYGLTWNGTYWSPDRPVTRGDVFRTGFTAGGSGLDVYDEITADGNVRIIQQDTWPNAPAGSIRVYAKVPTAHAASDSPNAFGSHLRLLRGGTGDPGAGVVGGTLLGIAEPVDVPAFKTQLIIERTVQHTGGALTVTFAIDSSGSGVKNRVYPGTLIRMTRESD